MSGTKGKRSRTAPKKIAAAQERLRRMEEAIAPFSKPAIPQIKAPKDEWVPGGEFSHIRRADEDSDPHPRMCVVEAD